MRFFIIYSLLFLIFDMLATIIEMIDLVQKFFILFKWRMGQGWDIFSIFYYIGFFFF